MRDRIKKDIFKIAYISNKRDEINNQIPVKIVIFYGKYPQRVMKFIYVFPH